MPVSSRLIQRKFGTDGIVKFPYNGHNIIMNLCVSPDFARHYNKVSL